MPEVVFVHGKQFVLHGVFKTSEHRFRRNQTIDLMHEDQATLRKTITTSRAMYRIVETLCRTKKK
jgi:hypothetical protein